MKKSFILNLIFFASLLQHTYAQQPSVSVTTGHSSLITRVAIAPKGNLVASNGSDHLIKIWDKNSGKEITTLNNKVRGVDNEQRIESIKFFNEGKYLLSTDENGMIKVWDIKNEKTIQMIEGGSGMPGLSADISGDRIVFINKNYTLSVTEKLNSVISDFSDFRIRIIKINPANPDEIFGVDLQNNFFMYNYVTKEKTVNFEKSEKYVFNVKISPDGKILAVVFSDMTLKLWNIKTGKLIKEITGIKPVNIDFHPKTNELIILNQDPAIHENVIYIFDTKKFEVKRKITKIGLFATYTDISDNGKIIALNSMQMKNRSTSYTVNLIDWQTGKIIKVLRSHAHAVSQIIMAKKTPRLAALYNDLNLKIWNLSTLQIEKVISYVMNIAANDKSDVIALRGYYKDAPGYNAIILYDMDSLKVKDFIPTSELFTDMKFSSDNKHIISCSLSGEISVWDIEQKKKIIHFTSGNFGYVKVDLSPDMKYVAFGASGSPGIKIYNIETKETTIIKEAHPILGVSDLKFSDDGKFLTSCSFDKEVAAWETGTWKKIRDFKGNIGPGYNININSSNNMIACGTMGSAVSESDYAVNLWNVSDENIKCRFLGHKSDVTCTAFGNQNKLLFSGSKDGTIKIWSADSCMELASCIAIDYDDYIFVTPDNHYTGSKDALKGVGFKMDGTELYPFEQYDLRLNRPDIIAEKLNFASPGLIKAFKKAYLKRLEKMGFNDKMLNNDFNLPVIKINNKNEIPFQSKETELTADISASDKNYTFDRINVWINDVPIYGREGIDLKDLHQKTINKKVKLSLSEGKNKIQISVLNSKGVESIKQTIETMAPSSVKKPDLYILAVGVSDYFDDNIDLNYAAKDASDFSDLYKNKIDKFENINIIKILNHDAIKENILKAKEELLKTNINDLVIIYTAGHGLLDAGLDYYFATADIDIYHPEEKGLSYDDLENLTDNIPARKKVLLMDACHSGEVDYDEYNAYSEKMSSGIVARSVYSSRTTKANIGLENSFRLMKELFADLRRGSGAVVISSAGGVEYAFESDKLKNGVFTYVLMKALKSMQADENSDGIISISELQKFVMKRVSELTAGRQNPTVRRENLEYNFEVW